MHEGKVTPTTIAEGDEREMMINLILNFYACERMYSNSTLAVLETCINKIVGLSVDSSLAQHSRLNAESVTLLIEIKI